MINKQKISTLYKIAGSIITAAMIVFLLLLFWDLKSTLSDKVVASSTVGLFLISLYGIVFQLGKFLYDKEKTNTHKKNKSEK